MVLPRAQHGHNLGILGPGRDLSRKDSIHEKSRGTDIFEVPGVGLVCGGRSLMENNGVPVGTIQRILGHES